jgi:hypothetical protein
MSNKLRFRGNRTLWNDNMSYSTESRVSRGVSWLDYFVPEWRSKVSVSELDMNSSAKCVIGQLFGSFSMAIKGGFLTVSQAREYGFAAGQFCFDLGGTTKEVIDDYSALQIEWTRVLKDVP